MAIRMRVPLSEADAPSTWDPLESDLREDPPGAVLRRRADGMVVAAADTWDEGLLFLRQARLSAVERMAAALNPDDPLRSKMESKIRRYRSSIGRGHLFEVAVLEAADAAPLPISGSAPAPSISNRQRARLPNPFEACARHLDGRNALTHRLRGISFVLSVRDGVWSPSLEGASKPKWRVPDEAEFSAHERLETALWRDRGAELLAEAAEALLPAADGFSGRIQLSSPVLGIHDPAFFYHPTERVQVPIGKGNAKAHSLLPGLRALEARLGLGCFDAGKVGDPLWELPAFLDQSPIGGTLDHIPDELDFPHISTSFHHLRVRRPDRESAMRDLVSQAMLRAFARGGQEAVDRVQLLGLRNLGKAEEAMEALAALRRG